MTFKLYQLLVTFNITGPYTAIKVCFLGTMAASVIGAERRPLLQWLRSTELLTVYANTRNDKSFALDGPMWSVLMHCHALRNIALN